MSAMRRLRWGFTIACILSFASICVAQNQCFTPNGEVAGDDFPCDPTATDSACCGGGMGTTCLTNKLCRGPNGNLIRGTCTDKDWKSPECAHYCMGATRGGHDLISCSHITNTDTSYCCDRHREGCCEEGVGRFDVLPSQPQLWARWDEDASQFALVERSTSTTSTTSLSSSTELSTTSSTSSSTSTDPTTSPTPSNTADPNPVPQAQPSESSEPFVLPMGAQAGIGAGAGVLVIALGAVAFLVWKLRRNKKALLAEKEQRGNGGNGALPAYHHHQQPYGANITALPYQNKEPYHPAELGVSGARYEMDPYS